jgi:integrase
MENVMARHARLSKPIMTPESRRNAVESSSLNLRDGGVSSPPIKLAAAICSYIAAGGEGRYLIASPLIARLGELDVSGIDQQIVDSLAGECWPNSSPATRSRQCYGPISAVLKFSARQGWCAHWRLKRPKLRKEVSPLPNEADLWKFVHACRPHLKRIVVFLLRTGVGVADALQLDWVEVDLVGRTARITSPNGHARLVLLDEIVAGRLAQTPPELRVGKVFLTHRGRPYRPRACAGGQLKSALAYAWKKAGVKITPSTLKRIWRARRRGKRPDVEVATGRTREIVANLMNSTLTKYREPESNGTQS